MTEILTGKTALAKRYNLAHERNGFNLVACTESTVGKSLCKCLGIAVFSQACTYNKNFFGHDLFLPFDIDIYNSLLYNDYII